MGSPKVTTGRKFKLAWHHSVGTGPLDAFLEFRGADKVAWKGRMTASGVAAVNKPQLWGGDKDQGGAVGNLRVMFGEAGQLPNAYLVSTFGPKTPACRGIATVVWEGGIWGSNAPWANKPAYRVERIKKGWDNDDCWYPETAAVPLDSTEVTTLVSPDVQLDANSSTLDGVGDGFEFSVPPGSTIKVGLGPSSDAWSYTPSDDYNLSLYPRTWTHRFGLRNLGTGGYTTHWPDTYLTAAEARATHDAESVEIAAPAGGDFRLFLWDAAVDDNRGTSSYRVSYSTQGSRYAENPAHGILFEHTQRWGGRQARESVDLDGLTAAADWFYARGFGLCSTRIPKDESPREWIRRIERVAGCSFSQSFDDGLWHLDIANGEYDLESLPIITDDDVLSFKESATVMDEAVNSVSVKYFDPERKETIITPPTRAMGLIAQFGEIHQTFDFPEIPIARIALEVALRELLASITPTRTFDLDAMPTVYKLRKNQYVRLQLPKRGIADMVCLVAEVVAGKLKSGGYQLKLAQDIYSLPETLYTEIELGEDTRPPTTPEAIEDQVAFEAPYISLVANMLPDELAALPEDAGYVVAAAVNPGGMRDFTMMVASAGGDYEEAGDGDFCPSCTLTGEVAPGLKLAIGFENGVRMDAVDVGDLALLGTELVRVDAIDLEANTLDLGRGCGDTLPALHDAGTRIFFYQRAAAYDPTQRTAGETVNVKLLSNSFVEQLALADAIAMPVTCDERWVRPYPPGDIKVQGLSIYDVGTSTPGSGGGGEGGSGGVEDPVVIGPAGVPLSNEVGPNGGYPDDGVYPIPQPSVFGVDLVTGGDFSDPEDIDDWRNRDGSALGPLWTLVGGELVHTGQDDAAYYYGGRYSLPIMPLKRYTVTVTAKLKTTGAKLARFGVAYGATTAGTIPIYIDAADAQSYPAQTTVTHEFAINVPRAAGYGSLAYTVYNFLPIVQFSNGSGGSPGSVDDVTMSIAEEVPATSTIAQTNLDFPSGLTGWTQWPDPTGNPYGPTISVSGGELSVTGNSEFWPESYFIGDDDLTADFEIGKYFGMGGEVWSNDPTILGSGASNKYPAGGATFGYAVRYADGSHTLHHGGMAERGDWTAREVWMRILNDASVLPVGASIHRLVTIAASPGYTTKVRALWLKVTDEVID